MAQRFNEMILYGAGGHAKVVHDCIISEGNIIHGIFDDNISIKSFMGIDVISPYSVGQFIHEKLIICIGSNRKRFELSKIIKHEFGSVIHKTAFLSENFEINPGIMIMAKSVIQTGATIGKQTIINTGAIIEHDCVINDFVHIGPGTVICGNVEIKLGAFIGANVTILPGLSIGKWAIIGAGSVVVTDVEEGSKIAGNPAKLL